MMVTMWVYLETWMVNPDFSSGLMAGAERWLTPFAPRF